ncbi:sugar phosphate isomerase/epimerase family protein [Demequina iriomotensis]|uniref:sugar phosphate isomerase/epimerase family protein n=1 Tax=Demequina iriomotensis TaxID=1536641 RepID=UPI000782275D|nr:sugar phosphate isomerase/epimerase [Demequina iriomotensis]
MSGTQRTTGRRTRRLALIATAVAAAALIGIGWAVTVPRGTAGAEATPPAGASSIPDASISIQMFTFFQYIGFGEDDAAQARQEEVLARLAEAGYSHVEPVDYTGFQGLDAEEYRALLDEHGLEASSLHTSVTMDTTDEQWADKLATATTLGAEYVGAGENPRTFTSRAEWVAFAERIDHLGAMARDAGMRYLVHLHDYEFTSIDGGQSAFEILVAHTSPENVTFELDLYWAVAAGEDPVALVAEHRDRIALLHVKDMDEDGEIATVGEGTIDFPAIFAEAGPAIDFYVVERDPVDDPAADPFGPAVAGLEYLRSMEF